MSLRAVEHLFTGDTVSYTDYDPDKTVLGKSMVQKDGFAGPAPIIVTRPMDEFGGFPTGFPSVIEIDDTTNYVFTIDVAAATTSRRIAWYIHDKVNGEMEYNGLFTLGGLTTNHTVRGFSAIRDIHNTGTVEVTNDGTDSIIVPTGYVFDRITSAGCRIGFGSNDPKLITTWYTCEFDIGLTENGVIYGTPLSFSAGTPYVIEEYRFVIANTASTTTNGGLFIMKGVRLDYFTLSGSGTFSLSTSTVDRIPRAYWLADASTVTNTIAMGLAVEPPIDKDTHYVYVCNRNSSSSLTVFKYNIRAALTSISAGKTTAAFVFKTGAVTITGSLLSDIGACCYADTPYVPNALQVCNSKNSLYIPTSDITNGATSFSNSLQNAWSAPDGSALAGANFSVSYDSEMNRFCFANGNGIALTGDYGFNDFTNYLPVDSYFSALTGQVDQALALPYGSTPSINMSSNVTTTAVTKGGYLYVSRHGTTAQSCFIHVLPVSSDWIAERFAVFHNGRYGSWTQGDDFLTNSSSGTLDGSQPAYVLLNGTGSWIGDTSLEDFQIQLSCAFNNISEDSVIGLEFCRQDDSNGYALMWGGITSGYPGVRLYKKNAGILTLLASNSADLGISFFKFFYVTKIGSTISAVVNQDSDEDEAFRAQVIDEDFDSGEFGYTLLDGDALFFFLRTIDLTPPDDSSSLILPKMDTTSASRLCRVCVNETSVIGSENLGTAPEPFFVFARTAGIDDNSGAWFRIEQDGDLSALTPTDELQIKLGFRTNGFFGVPARLLGVAALYEDGTGDSHYEGSVEHSDLANERFAWRFARSFGSDVPDLRVRLYNAATGSELVDDDTTSPTGTFEQSTNNGSSWSAWTNADKTNETTYIRYTPSSLTNDIVVRALLTQL